MKLKDIKNKSKKRAEHETAHEKDFLPKLYRNISFYFTPLFMKFTPNQVSILSIVTGFVGVLLLLLEEYYTYIGLLLYFLGIILDFVDGNVARAKKQTSKWGVYLDTVNHAIVPNALFIVLGLILAKNTNNGLFFILGLVAGFFNQLSSIFSLQFKLIEANIAATKKEVREAKKETKVSKASLLEKLKILLFPVDHHFELLLLAVIINQLEIYLVVITVNVLMRSFGFYLKHYVSLRGIK